MSADEIPQARWRPWHGLHTEGEAVRLARAGVILAGLVLAGYLIQLGLAVLAGRPAGAWADALPIAVAGLLMWRIWARQALWAAGLASLWFVAETLARLLADPAPPAARGAGVIMYAALSAAALTALAATLALRGLRPKAEDGIDQGDT